MLTEKQRAYLANANSGWKMKLWQLLRLPSMFFWGGRVEEATAEHTLVSVPYGWRTQNPFSSVYFAVQCGVGELATGLLVQTALAGQERKISMLVTDFRGQFTKKATERIYYRCDQGQVVQAAVERCVALNEPQEFQCLAIGTTQSGLEVGRVYVTWSVKAK